MKLFCPKCETKYEGDDLEMCPDDGAQLFRLDTADGDDPFVGEVIDDRFRIGDLIGAGGMGAVYRGMQLSVERQVAIKVIRPELVEREVALERFFREAKVISGLTHPNIVRLVDFGRDDDLELLYLVMELVEGIELGELLRRGRLRPALALEVAYQVCGALTEPHAHGVVHRDLKPGNLLISPVSDGTFQVKVLDFGVARALDSDTQLTDTGMVCGTPAYMSPEQAQDVDLDARSDLYAVGVILFEMLTGHPPFVGESNLQVLMDQVRRPAPDLLEITPEGAIPAPVAVLVGRLLAKTPDERPGSARRVRECIDELRERLELKSPRLREKGDDAQLFEDWLVARFDIPELYEDDEQQKRADGERRSDQQIGGMATGDAEQPRGESGSFDGERIEPTDPREPEQVSHRDDAGEDASQAGALGRASRAAATTDEDNSPPVESRSLPKATGDGARSSRANGEPSRRFSRPPVVVVGALAVGVIVLLAVVVYDNDTAPDDESLDKPRGTSEQPAEPDPQLGPAISEAAAVSGDASGDALQAADDIVAEGWVVSPFEHAEHNTIRAVNFETAEEGWVGLRGPDRHNNGVYMTDDGAASWDHRMQQFAAEQIAVGEDGRLWVNGRPEGDRADYNFWVSDDGRHFEPLDVDGGWAVDRTYHDGIHAWENELLVWTGEFFNIITDDGDYTRLGEEHDSLEHAVVRDAYVDGDEIWAAGAWTDRDGGPGNQPAVFHSSDRGASWNKHILEDRRHVRGGKTLYGIHRVDGVIWAVGDARQIHYSQNGGDSWEQIGQIPEPFREFRGVGGQGERIIAVATVSSGPGTLVYESRDGGGSWETTLHCGEDQQRECGVPEGLEFESLDAAYIHTTRAELIRYVGAR